MDIKQLYKDNLRKLPNEYRDVSIIISLSYAKSLFKNILDIKFLFVNQFSKFLRHILGLKECLIVIR